MSLPEPMEVDQPTRAASFLIPQEATLDSLPMEIVIEILCRVASTAHNLKDLYNVARTCKRLHGITHASLRAILSPLGQRDVHHFDLALTAVRATNLVEHALKTDQLVRQEDMFPIENLSGQARPPTLTEFSAVLALQNFGSIAAYTIVGEVDGLFRTRLRQFRTIDSWRRRFYRTLYRLIICGAALSVAYLEPFIQTAIPHPDDFLNRILNCTVTPICSTSSSKYEPTSSDFEYFDQFPLYRASHSPTVEPSTKPPKDVEAIFKPVSDWLLQDMASAALEAESEALPLDQLEPWRPLPDNAWRNRAAVADIAGFDFPTPWPVHRQLQQGIRLALELGSKVKTDEWGNGILLTRDQQADLDFTTGMPWRRHLATMVMSPSSRPFGNDTPACSVRTARAVPYGVFRPEVLVTPDSQETKKRLGPQWIMSYEAQAAQAHLTASQVTPATMCQRLFGGLPSNVLSLERVFQSLAHCRPHWWAFGGTRHRGLLSYMEGLEETQLAEEPWRVKPTVTWNDFCGELFSTFPVLFGNGRRVGSGGDPRRGWREQPGGYTIV